MGISNTTKIDSAFKFIHGKGYTTSQKGLENEDAYGGFILGSNSIFINAGDVPGTPPGSSTAFVHFYNPFQMVQDISSPAGTAWYASTDGSTLTTMRNTRVGNWVSPQFGQSYTVQIHMSNSGTPTTQVFFSDATGPLFDYKTGILTFESNPLAAYPGNDGIQVIGYTYIGALLSDVFDGDGYLIRPISDAATGTARGYFDATDGFTITKPTGATFSLFVNGDGYFTGNIYINSTLFTVPVAATTSANGLVELFSTSPTPSTPKVSVTDSSGNVVGRGLTRDTSGALSVGAGSNDASITLGKADQVLTLLSDMTASRTTASSVVPMTLYENADGYVRYLIDRNGYPMGGHNSIFREEWFGVDTQTVSFPNGATADVRNTGGRWKLEPDTTNPSGTVAGSFENTGNVIANFCAVTSSTSSASQWFVRSGSQVWAGSSWMDMVADADVIFPTAALFMNYYVGVVDHPENFGTRASGAYFYINDSYGGDFQCVVVGGSTTVTAIAPSGGSNADRLRLEYHGSATSLGTGAANGKWYFYINEVLAATINAFNVPGGLYYFFGIDNPGIFGGSIKTIEHGPLTIAWNRYHVPPSF